MAEEERRSRSQRGICWRIDGWLIILGPQDWNVVHGVLLGIGYLEDGAVPLGTQLLPFSHPEGLDN